MAILADVQYVLGFPEDGTSRRPFVPGQKKKILSRCPFVMGQGQEQMSRDVSGENESKIFKKMTIFPVFGHPFPVLEQCFLF